MTGARTDWEDRIGRRSDTAAAGAVPVLAPPAGLYAAPGVGQVSLHWEPVLQLYSTWHWAQAVT